MKISVVVPAFNEEKLITQTLASIKTASAAFDAIGWQTELIVCDNNSTDKTSEFARHAGASVVFEPINQISRARNTGASAATGDWLLFVDADSQPSVELFADVANSMQTGRYLAGGSTVCLDKQPGLVASIGTACWNTVSRTCRWCAGSFIFCETKAFRAVGGFSLELFASEELELSKKLKKLARQQGKRLVILHQHPLRTSSRKLHLYGPADAFRFMRQLVQGPKAALRSRESCAPWYDGRR